MQQVLMNLCTNAAHAMRGRGGSISIDLAGFSFSSSEDAPDPTMSPGLYTKLSIMDTGVGMSSETIGHLFDPFFTTKAAGEGTGLGLSVVHGIVASHGGTITVSSEQNKGSTFTIYLPELLEERPRTSADGGSSIPGGHERILFVDDEHDLTAMASQMLMGLGYHVTARTGAREALALFRSDPSRFDLVISDQTMPEMTGLDLAGEILTLRADMPIIMCTGYSPLVDSDTARAVGIKALAMKPLTKKEIAATIRKVLDERLR
jgi:CheY-like chemotaxis protein